MNSSFQVHRFFLALTFIVIFCSKSLTAQQVDSASSWVKVTANLEQYYIVIDEDFKNPHLIDRGDSVRVSPGKSHITVVWRTINDHSFTINAKPGETVGRQIVHTFPSYPRSSYETIVSQTNLLIATDENSTVYIDGEQSGKHLVEILLKPGTHRLRIEHPEYGVLRETVEVNSQSITKIARYNENPSNLSFAAKLIPGAEYIASRRYKQAGITYLGLGLLAANLVRQDIAYDKELSEYNRWESLYKNAQTTRDAILYREGVLSSRGNLQKISKNFNLTLLITAGVYLVSTLDAFRKPKNGYQQKMTFLSSTEFTFLASTQNYKLSPGFTFKVNFEK